MIFESTAAYIIYFNLFIGIHGKYLNGLISASSVDYDNLAVFDS